VFFACAAVTCVVVALLAFWPAVQEAVVGHATSPDAAGYGLPSPAAAFQGRFSRLCGLCAVGTTAVYLAGLRKRRRRLLRTLTLLAALVGYAGLCVVHDRLACGEQALGALASGDLFELQWHNLEHLRIVECQPAHLRLNAFAAREEFRARGLRTFAEFHRAVMERYAGQRDWLRNHWGLAATADEQKLRTLFFTNFVAGMWNFGNAHEVDQPGCVSCNERNRGTASPPTLLSYLDSEIACCTDYAYLMKSLLDHEGIENRLTEIPGHVFNEVRLGGHWCIADASCNLFIESGWGDLYAAEHGRDSITALVFPHPNALSTGAERYRTVIGRFRLLMLVRIVNHPEMLRRASHPDLPSCFN
jgi:hypothetical protein